MSYILMIYMISLSEIVTKIVHSHLSLINYIRLELKIGEIQMSMRQEWR